MKTLVSRVLIGGALISGALISGAPVTTSPAGAAARATVGYRDASHAGTTAPTAEKPQSKLWFHAGNWWGVLFQPSTRGGRFTIHRFDRGGQRWIDTGVATDTRENVHLDALAHGDHLYVASSRGSANPALDRKVRVWGYTYDRASKTYEPDRGFPVAIAEGDIEAVVIDRDSKGILWATFVLNGQVMVTHSSGGPTRWVPPYVLPVGAAAAVRAEPWGDQSAVVAFGGSHVGVMFSSQIDPTGIGVMYWATHADGAGDRAWELSRAFAGPRLADEHINLKALPKGDRAGQVLAAVKTSQHGTREPNDVVHVLRLKADGAWTSHRYGTVAENHTRPLLQIDVDQRRVYVFAVSSCCRGDTVYVKGSSLDALSFAPGRGTPFIQSASDANVNNPTGTKQLLGRGTGVLVLAGDDATDTYLHNYLGGPAVALATRRADAQARAQAASGAKPSGPTAPAAAASRAVDDGAAGSQAAEPTRPSAGEPLVRPTTLTRQGYFGWFAKFFAFTGLEVGLLVSTAAAALCVGGSLVYLARRRLRANAGVR
jgi:hypothetical protein